MDTSANPENVPYNAIDAKKKRTTDLGSVGDEYTHTMQTMKTAQMTGYWPRTSHEVYPDSPDVGDRTTHNTSKGANSAFHVVVHTMHEHELLKRQ